MRVAVLKAKGDGGLQDPKTGVYISSLRETIAPYSDWAESLVNHDKIELIEVLDESNYGEYVNHLAEADGNEEAALKSYRSTLPSGRKGKTEKVIVAENAADLERQEAEMQDGKKGRTPKETAPVVNAESAKPAEAK